jgi:flagellar motor component MotA
MIKSLGIFLMVLFAGFSYQLGDFAPGFALYFMMFLTLASGGAGIWCLLMPEHFMDEVWSKSREALPMGLQKLSLELESISALVRQEGLFALESRRKDIRDPMLRYLLKKVMDGFEQAALVPIIRNQMDRRLELTLRSESVMERYFSLLPTVGLIPSLSMMMQALLPGKEGGAGLIAVSLLPFALSLLFQLLVQAWNGSFFEAQREDIRLYFSLLQEGLIGIQEGQNVELLRDRMRARSQVNPKWVDS